MPSKYLDSFKERHKDEIPSTELDKRLLELSALFEISQTLNSTLNLKTILDNILFVPMGRMMINKGLILFQHDDHQFKIENIKGLPLNLIHKEIHITSLPDHPVFLKDYQTDEDWIDFFRNFKIELLIPLISQRDFRGLIGFSGKLTAQPFDDDEINFLSSLAHLAVQAIENARTFERLNAVNRQLDHRVQELNTLFEIGAELNQIFDPQKVLKQLSYSLMGQLLINQFFVMLKDEEGFKIAYQKGLLFKEENLEKCRPLCESLPEIPEPVVLNEEDTYPELYELGVRLIVPMRIQNRVGGFIFLGEKVDKHEYTRSNIHFLSTLANMAMISLENARLIQETIEKERIEEELYLAQDIQRRLLPTSMPELDGYYIDGLNIPSKQVGGDFFDIIHLQDNEYLLTIADVSGKGMPAALLVSNLQAGIHSLLDSDLPLNEMTFRLNNLIHKNTNIEKYITFFILRINLDDGTFSYVNGGHNPPYIFSKKKEERTLEKGGLILGMMPNVSYELGRDQLLPGECLVMFTDGVTEAMDEQEHEFEEKGLIELVKPVINSKDSQEINQMIIDAIKEFSSNPVESDDITLLTINRIS
ncbi:MAG: SpoIIE family protein phosphatase [Caldithrix sp.]|nr:SpoIIE family protein phosphatase [Caldithrix sp.]